MSNLKKPVRRTLADPKLSKGMGHNYYGEPALKRAKLKNKEYQSATFICPVCGQELEEIGWWCECFYDRPDSYPREW
jgi:hypothetical protein